MKNEFWGGPGPNEPGNEMGHHGSTNLKHQKSGPKMPRRTSEVDFGRSNFRPSRNDDCQKMLSFSSYEPLCSSGMSIEFSICQDENQTRTGGGLMRGRVKGPFTPSQWMELEHQALIYKHIVTNVPVPSNLLVPFKRSLYSYGSSYPSNYLGWGPFHLGYSSSGSNDPEPGRCRRTDGKKWRCSRDAVPDQKYCERHINRGRHRSRKPVEGQNGRVGSATTTTSKVEPIVSSSSPLVGAMHHQFNSLLPNTEHLISRTQGFQGHPLIPSTLDLQSKDVPFSIQKQNIPFEEASSYSMFGLVSSDSLVNPSETITYTNTKNPDSFMGFTDKEPTTDQHQVHHFIDDWPKDQPNRATCTSWPEELKSDWTQLSMSIPMAPDFSSSSTSSTQEKSTISTNELDPIHMNLGTSHNFGKPVDKQSWVPVSWGNSMGGPLGEVLTSTSSSPTGVLQKPIFVTLSNSSSVSSPHSRDSKKAHETANICNVLGSDLVSSTAIPSL